MKKAVFGFGLLLFVCAVCGVAAAGQFGPTEPTANPGSFSLGVGYFYDNTKWESPTLFGADLGTFRTESNQGYVQGSYAVDKNWEISGRVGGASFKLKNDPDLSDSAKFFGGLGVKGVLYSDKMFSIGAFAQGTFYSNYKDSVTEVVSVNGTNVTATGDFEFKNRYAVDVGVSGQVKIQNVAIYGGPFFYYSRAKFEATVAALGQSISDSDTVKAKGAVGGFLGVSLPITKEVKLNLEGQVRSRFSGGAMISYSF